MERKNCMNEKVKISEIPINKTFDDYPEDTVFVLDEEDEESWDDEN